MLLGSAPAERNTNSSYSVNTVNSKIGAARLTPRNTALVRELAILVVPSLHA